MELLKLTCSGCGGALEVARAAVIEDGQAVVIRRGEIIRCPFCGTEYAVGEELPVTMVVNTAFDQRGQRVGNQVNITGHGNIVGSGNESAVVHDDFLIAASGIVINGLRIR